MGYTGTLAYAQQTSHGLENNIPILAYHSWRILGNTYHANDHIALRQDLRTLHALGFRIVPLAWIVDWVLGHRDDSQMRQVIGLSFDDGSNPTYLDISHPQYGFQQSFYHILLEFREEVGDLAQPSLSASAFVIASEEARKDIGGHSLSDGWWPAAHETGLLNICNHGWDHQHPEASLVCEESQQKGNFKAIDTYAESSCEIERAAHYIHEKIGVWPDLFAYPWGQSSRYVREVYFPTFPDQHKTRAAFAAQGGYVTKNSSRWNLPRFVCGAHWKSPEGLHRILNAAR